MKTNLRIRCKKCQSTLVYIRLNKNERVCRSCGNIEKLDVEDNPKKKPYEDLLP